MIKKKVSLETNQLIKLKDEGFPEKELIQFSDIVRYFKFDVFANSTTLISIQGKMEKLDNDLIEVSYIKITNTFNLSMISKYYQETEIIYKTLLNQKELALNRAFFRKDSPDIPQLFGQEVVPVNTPQRITNNNNFHLNLPRSSKKIKKPKKNYSGDLKFKASIMKEVGGLGGNPFIISNNSKITDIWIRYGNVIDSIAWRYEDGTYHRYGGSGGSEIHIQFDDDEFLQGIFGKSGSFIDSMGFITNNGDEVYGPFGGTGGYDFNFLANGQSYIQGFKGRSGCYIDRIGIIMDS